jgi:hypothetical protein
MPGTPYSRDHLLGILDRALAEGDADFALRTARNVDPPIELDRALRLTIALTVCPPSFSSCGSASARVRSVGIAVEDEDVAGGVAGDEHLLDLADRIPVLTPAEFLAG